MSLTVLSAGPGVCIQDRGRPGLLALGVARGGAMDPLALDEGAALLGQDPKFAAIEMAGFGGTFRADQAMRIALTGAPMRASVDGHPLDWAASYALSAGAVLQIGAASPGSYGYLHVGGGFDVSPILGARSAELKTGMLGRIAAGDVLPIGQDAGGPVGLMLDVADRFSGGTVRLLQTTQTTSFPSETRTRFAVTTFTRDARSNRQAIRLGFGGDGFGVDGGLAVLSEITQPGDVQVTGDGTPMILMAEAQTTGGYPRIGTVLPSDLPLVAQAPAGADLRFEWMSVEDALAAEARAARGVLTPRPRIRNPQDIPDLLRYRLVDGFVTGEEEL